MSQSTGKTQQEQKEIKTHLLRRLRQVLEHENWMSGLAALWLHNPLPCWMEHKKVVKEYIKMTTTTYLSLHFMPGVGLTLI
jgi:hypothetical protein